MGFILGFLLGLLTAIVLFGFLTYWLCSRSNNVAVAKFINGIAQALAHRPIAPPPLAPDRNGQAPKLLDNGQAATLLEPAKKRPGRDRS